MQLRIDNRETDCGPEYSSLQDVLENIVKETIDTSRMVWSVKVDGRSYCEKVPYEAGQMSLADIHTLEVDTKSAEEVCQDFLHRSGSLLECLAEGADRVSALFRGLDYQEANRQYHNLLESCQGFFALLHESEAILGLDEPAAGLKPLSLRNALNSSSSLFDSMLAAQKSEDWTILADLLEYELSPLLLEYRNMIVSRAA